MGRNLDLESRWMGRPYRAEFVYGWPTQGVALGYRIMPLWGGENRFRELDHSMVFCIYPQNSEVCKVGRGSPPSRPRECEKVRPNRPTRTAHPEIPLS